MPKLTEEMVDLRISLLELYAICDQLRKGAHATVYSVPHHASDGQKLSAVRHAAELSSLAKRLLRQYQPHGKTGRKRSVSKSSATSSAG